MSNKTWRQNKKVKNNVGTTTIETNLSYIRSSDISGLLGEELVTFINGDEYYLNKGGLDTNDKAI